MKRSLLVTPLLVGAMLTACAHLPGESEYEGLLDPATQPKFVEPLPNLLAQPLVPQTGVYPGTDYYHITMAPLLHEFGTIDPDTGKRLQTSVWGYGRTPKEASYPGPTIVARSTAAGNRDGRPVKVRWVSELPNEHLLPIDTTVHCGPRKHEAHSHCRPFVRTVAHLHGGHVPDHSDGYPEAWFTPGFTEVGPQWSREVYDYPNDQEAATLWYHDHAQGITRLNVYAGLAGFYLIRDDREDRLRADGFLPDLAFEVPLMIQDRSFKRDGALAYAAEPGEIEQRKESAEGKGAQPGQRAARDPVTGELVSSIEPEFFGDTIVVNGKVWPVLEVQPRMYRLRFLNGSNARFYHLTFDAGVRFRIIGGDGGFLPQPVTRKDLLLAPAERTDVLVDFARPDLKGQTLILRNDARSPFPNGEPVDPATTGQVMAFRVNQRLSSMRDAAVPLTLRPPLATPAPTNTRQLLLVENKDGFGRLMPLLGTVADGPLGWDDPITELPKLGSTEIWEIVNASEDAHPVHLHLVQFRILDRQAFDAQHFVARQPSTLKRVGTPRPPSPEETGWKDTAIAYPGEVLRVAATFDLPGLYVWHCHILEHEDHEMMRPYRVVP